MQNQKAQIHELEAVDHEEKSEMLRKEQQHELHEQRRRQEQQRAGAGRSTAAGGEQQHAKGHNTTMHGTGHSKWKTTPPWRLPKAQVDTPSPPPPYINMTNAQKQVHEILHPARGDVSAADVPPHLEHASLYRAVLEPENDNVEGPHIVVAKHREGELQRDLLQQNINIQENLRKKKVNEDFEKKSGQSRSKFKAIMDAQIDRAEQVTKPHLKYYKDRWKRYGELWEDHRKLRQHEEREKEAAALREIQRQGGLLATIKARLRASLARDAGQGQELPATDAAHAGLPATGVHNPTAQILGEEDAGREDLQEEYLRRVKREMEEDVPAPDMAPPVGIHDSPRSSRRSSPRSPSSSSSHTEASDPVDIPLRGSGGSVGPQHQLRPPALSVLDDEEERKLRAAIAEVVGSDSDDPDDAKVQQFLKAHFRRTEKRSKK